MTIADLNSEARALVDADSTSYTAADLLRRINIAYEEVVSFIMGIDGKWQFDDSNYTDFPIATTTLVEAQEDYALDLTFLEIERVQVKDNSGNWHLLQPFDISEIGIAIDEYLKDDGLPAYYDKTGKSIILKPAPTASQVTLSAGLKVWFKRTADLYTSAQVTTGTKVPGFASPFHVILAYKAALPYAQSYKRDRVPMIVNEINRLEKEMKNFYGRRELDRRKIMTTARISHR